MNTRLSTFLTLLFILSSLMLFAQPPRGNRQGPPPQAIITGKVIDADTETPLEFATITLFSKRDSSIVSGGITDEMGAFTIETRPGRLYAKVEFLSYSAKLIEEIPLKRGQLKVDLGTIGLEADATLLNTVEVRAEKSEMQISLDKKVFNVGKDLANKGGTAEEILDNVPSVTVDVEGNVSLRGSENVRILIDGKPSGILGSGNGLRSLPSNMIDKIEVITNPSARYEAEGMAGIINIVLQKERKKGINGSVEATIGYPDNYGVGLNLNYRRNKFNFFTNYSLRYRRGPGSGFNFQEQTIDGTFLISDQRRSMNRGGLTNRVRGGFDYYFSDKDILTAAFSYSFADEDNEATLEYFDYIESLDNLDLYTRRSDDEFEEERESNYELSYKKIFEGKGHELTALVRVTEDTETEGSDLTERYFDANNLMKRPDSLQRSNNTEGERRYLAKLDYVRPFATDGKFETGYFGSIRDITNDYIVEEFGDEAWSPLADFTNNFIYDERIHATYLILGNKTGQFSYQAGLRAEYTDVTTELEKSDHANQRDYMNLFPSAFLNYEFLNKTALQVSYSRRIRRPRFWDLNPFFTFSDSRRNFGGNPDLNPEFTNSYELSYIKYWENATLSSSLYYRHTTDVISRVITVVDGRPAWRPQNLAMRDDYGLELTYSLTPVKWWRLNGEFNFFRSQTEGDEFGSADTYAWTTRATSRWTFWKGSNFQLRYNYRGPRETTQGKRFAVSFLDLGLSKDVLKKKGTLTLSVRDLFNSRKRRGITELEDYYEEYEFQWRERQTTLSFTYRINEQKRRGRRGGGDFGGEGGGF